MTITLAYNPCVTTSSSRRRNERREPGLGILAATLLFAIHQELYARLEEAGHDQLTYLHGAVIAHLDNDGTRPTELAERSGRHKQVITRIVDELEALGYVERRPDRLDRRAKLVVPTERGLEVMRLSDAIVHDIERRQARLLGKATYQDFREAFKRVVESLTRPQGEEESSAAPSSGGSTSRGPRQP
jgi:DNA-binding MarR family transcriptional regulator